MFNFHLTYKWTFFTKPTGAPPAPPSGIERHWIDTPSGRLEILSCGPKDPSSKVPIYFVHGGMGGAWVWTEYMQYMAAKGIPTYAISMRGHGNSWYPSYIRMVYFTPKSRLAEDVVAGLKWVEKKEGRDVMLVGHSSGGGLSQYILSERMAQVKGLALLGAVPGFGSAGVYMNWAKFDPWFTLRMIFHGWHPNSPLSHEALTKNAFFSDKIPDSYVRKFQEQLNRYESFLWPLGMMSSFTNAQNIVQQISGRDGADRLLVMSGSGDKMMTFPIMDNLATIYRQAWSSLIQAKKVDGEPTQVKPISGEGNLDNAGMAVRFCIVPGAGHHLQNDVQWKVGAEKLFRFHEQL